MYRFEWFERRKLGSGGRQPVGVAGLSPVIWGLGFTSLLTDISSEMVASILPAYLFLHLRLGPLQYGIIDGIYNGFAIATVSLAAGFLADRYGRHKFVAGLGYGLSAACKAALLPAGGAWHWIMLVVGVDRLGKGIRSAPRDAILSMNAPDGRLASAFALHRSLDAGGAVLGPVVAAMVLAAVPGGYDVVWVVSLAVAVLGGSVLWLYVPQPRVDAQPVVLPTADTSAKPEHPLPASEGRQFHLLAGCCLLLAATTVSDGFVFLRLQSMGGLSAGLFPLYFVVVSALYMLLSVPAGLIADRFGRRTVMIGGYLVLTAVYAILLFAPGSGGVVQLAVVAMMGLYYACTEGILMAMGSALLPERRRTTGLAVLGTVMGLGKAASSVTFGWLMQAQGGDVAVATFMVLLPLTVMGSAIVLRRLG